MDFIYLLGRILLILAPPLVEILFLRYLIQINLVLLFPVNQILTPVGLVLAAFIYLLHKQGSLSIKLQKRNLFINASALLAFLWLNLNLQSLPPWMNPVAVGGIWFGLGILTLGSGFFIFLNFKDFTGRLNKLQYEALFAFLAGSCLTIYFTMIPILWPFLALPTTKAVYHILNLLGFAMIPTADPLILKHRIFEIYVGEPCSGMEGISFFAFIWSLTLMFDWKIFTKGKIVGVYLAGIIYMFLLNIVRITIFFIIALRITQKVDESSARNLLLWLFHSHIGWVFYLVGIFFFFAFLFRSQKQRGESIVF